MKPKPQIPNVFIILWTDKGNVGIPARRFVPKLKDVRVNTYLLPK